MTIRVYVKPADAQPSVPRVVTKSDTVDLAGGICRVLWFKMAGTLNAIDELG